MVSALDSRSGGLGSSHGRVIVLCSLLSQSESDFILTVSLSTQEYKLASHPGRVAILLVASCYRNRDKLRQ